MEFRRYLDLAFKWIWLVALGTTVAAGIAYYLTHNEAPVYRASTTLLVNQPGSVLTGDTYSSILGSERLTRTYAELVRKRPVLETVNSRLSLPYTSDDTARLVSTQLVRDTQLLILSAENTNPVLARDIANTLADVFVETTESLYTNFNTDARERMDKQLDGLEQEILKTSTEIEALRNAASTSQQAQAEVARLQSALSQYQNTYSILLKDREETRVKAFQSVVTMTVVEPAVVPQRPVRPRLLFNVATSGAIGLLVSIALAFLLEFFDDTIKSSEDIERIPGVTTMGSIRRFRPEEASDNRLILKESTRSALSEAYRVLRTNIQFVSVDKPLQTILVTSANPAEGKSTTIANLSIVMAQAGKQVILVDGDLRRPSLHRMFGLSNTIGLTNVLLSDDPAQAMVLQSTGVDGLSLLSSGPLPPNPSELLGSQRMAKALEYLKTQADIVLIDSPPAMSVTDPVVLAGLVDGVIAVVDAGRTRAGALLRLKELIGATRTPLIGVVLNKLLESSSGYYYRYYYYYSHYGHRDGDRQRERQSESSNGRRSGLAKLFRRGRAATKEEKIA
jgi:polysaccharide biosynthesis transport protein